MNGLTALLDWIDEAAGALIRLAYLAAGVTAVAVYFGAGHLPGPIDEALNNALPWALAFAVETHTYITARRVRSAWQDRQAAPRESDERARADAALRVNLAVLAGLLAFSAWNQLGYLSASGWQPGGTAFALPSWLAYLVRALVVPTAFMAAAFLAPLAAPVSAQIESEARAVLADVLRIARKQRKRMLRDAERIGRDMTGALVELVPDPEARRVISHVYGAIGAPVTGTNTLPALAGPSGSLPARTYGGAGAVHTAETSQHTPGPSERSESRPGASGEPSRRPPTGPGSPAVAVGSTPTREEATYGSGGRVVTWPERPQQRRRVRARGAAARGGMSPAERRVRAVLARDPGISKKDLAKRARVSSSTASKYLRLVESERTTAGAIAQ